MTRPSRHAHLLLMQDGLQERAARRARKRAQHDVLHIVLQAAQPPHKGFLTNLTVRCIHRSVAPKVHLPVGIRRFL